MAPRGKATFRGDCLQRYPSVDQVLNDLFPVHAAMLVRYFERVKKIILQKDVDTRPVWRTLAALD